MRNVIISILLAICFFIIQMYLTNIHLQYINTNPNVDDTIGWLIISIIHAITFLCVASAILHYQDYQSNKKKK